MSEEIPMAARSLTPNPEHVFLKRIGSKCIVRSTPTVEGSWLEIGGVAESGDIYVDGNQARVYCRMTGGGSAECRVVLPDDIPFRASRKGKVPPRSKSYDADGNPVPGVRLLYALKTKQRDDRIRAVEALPVTVWGPYPREEILSKVHTLAENEDAFLAFVGELIARDLSQQMGMANWDLWKDVADKAADFTKNRLAIAEGVRAHDDHDLFVQAVKEVTIELNGLPMQSAVEKLWYKLGAIGSWREVRNTLGFRWLASEHQWKKSWPTYIASAKTMLTIRSPQVDDAALGKSDESIPGIWPDVDSI